MSGRLPKHDFVEPMILKILKESRVPMSILAINYRVNEAAGRAININVIKNHLIFLVNNKKVFERLDKENDVKYYS